MVIVDLLASILLTVFQSVVAQTTDKSRHEEWQREFDLYQCGSEPKNGGCFCGFLQDRLFDKSVSLSSAGPSACYNGFACTPEQNYPCQDIELLSFLGLSELNAASGSPSHEMNDVWGWADPNGGLEVAIVGSYSGTAFVDVTDPVNPIYLGKLPTHGGSFAGSSWRDIKTIGNYALIVSEELSHGMQVFDLTQLRTASPSTTFSETAHYSEFGDAHNIFVNEETAVAYAVGTGTCSGGLHMIDVSDPTNPTFLSCFSCDGYTHDVQCVLYQGSDTRYTGREICFACNEDTVTIVDVTDKNAPVQLSKTDYEMSFFNVYTHQGWLTEDHDYFIFGDELDETRMNINTRTLVLSVADLINPSITGFHIAPTNTAIDHNQYILGQYVFQANYRSGLRILEIVDPATATLAERAFFDIYPSDDQNEFNGAWSTYPYFPSGTILVSGIEQGLFVLRWNQSGPSTQPTEQCMITKAPVVPPTPAPTFVPPNNNRCEGAIPVVVGSTTRGTTVAAVHNVAETGIYCGTTINSPGVWYKLSGSDGLMTVDTCSFANYDSKISVFEGTACDQLSCIDGDDDGCGGFSAPSTVSWSSQTGSTYYILVHGWESAVGLFDLTVSLQPAPTNNQCEGAVEIGSSGGLFSGSTDLATAEQSVAPCGTSSLGKGVWYSLTGVQGNVVVSMCGLNVNYDTQVSIYKGPCGSLTCVDGDDDGCGGFSAPSLINFESESTATEYKIYIHGYSSQSGNFEFDVQVPVLVRPANECNFGLGIYCFLKTILLAIIDFITFWN